MLEPFQRSVIAIVASFSFANQDVAIQIVVMKHLCKMLTAQANNMGRMVLSADSIHLTEVMYLVAVLKIDHVKRLIWVYGDN